MTTHLLFFLSAESLELNICKRCKENNKTMAFRRHVRGWGFDSSVPSVRSIVGNAHYALIVIPLFKVGLSYALWKLPRRSTTLNVVIISRFNHEHAKNGSICRELFK